MKREQIIEILENHEVSIETKGFYGTEGGYGVQDCDYSKIADAILALPLNVPSDDEILKQVHKNYPYYDIGWNDITMKRQLWPECAKWMRDEIIKRNK